VPVIYCIDSMHLIRAGIYLQLCTASNMSSTAITRQHKHTHNWSHYLTQFLCDVTSVNYTIQQSAPSVHWVVSSRIQTHTDTWDVFLLQHCNITEEHTVCFRAVDAEEMVVAPQNAVAVLHLRVARHRASIHACSTHICHNQLYAGGIVIRCVCWLVC